MRRSRSLVSRARFAIVVFFLPFDAISVTVLQFGVRRNDEGPAWGPLVRRRKWSLERLDVRRGRALRAVLGVVAHLRALGKRLEAAPLDRRVVNEQVLAGFVRCDEPEPLVVVEPLHGSCSHLFSPPGYVHCETRRVLSGNN